MTQQKLKVLHIPDWYPSESHAARGIFVREHVKATALYADVVVLYNEGWDNLKTVYQIKEQIEDGIRVLRVRHRRFLFSKTTYIFYFWSIFAAFKRLVREGWKPDIIHAHVYRAGVPAVFLGKRYGIPVVVTEHSTEFPRGLVKGLALWKAKFAFENAAFVCPVSRDLAMHIKRLGVKTRFRVIPNVVDTTLFYPLKEEKEEKKEEKRLLTVALLNPKKGIPYLLQALALLKEKRDDFILDIVGDGPSRHEYEELVKSLGLDGKVIFHGLKPKTEVAEFMRRADVFVLPSLWENLPCVIIEAMASGLPVIATKVGGIPEMIDEETGILIPAGDVKSLFLALDKCLDCYSTFNKDRIASKARQLYSPMSVGKQFLEIYQNALQRRHE